MAKDKLPRTFARNPYVAAVRNPQGPFREKTAKSDAERADQRDRFSRNAKYKASVEDFDMTDDDLEEGFQHGDEVNVEVTGTDEAGKKTKTTKTGMVKNPKAPLGMVGITVDGKYALVPEDELTLVEEALARMIELSK
jgi:hypothetical protein